MIFLDFDLDTDTCNFRAESVVLAHALFYVIFHAIDEFLFEEEYVHSDEEERNKKLM